MNLTELLDKHFTKEDFAAVELYKWGDRGCKLMLHGNTRFDHMMKGRAPNTYELWQNSDGDYPSMRVTQYEMLAVYDASDIAKVRAFMVDYATQVDDDDLRYKFRELFCCG